MNPEVGPDGVTALAVVGATGATSSRWHSGRRLGHWSAGTPRQRRRRSCSPRRTQGDDAEFAAAVLLS